MEAYRIKFLLPGLTDAQRSLLLHLRLLRIAMTLICNIKPEELEESCSEYEVRAGGVERDFMEAKRAVLESGIMEEVGSVEWKVLEREFLNVWDGDH